MFARKVVFILILVAVALLITIKIEKFVKTTVPEPVFCTMDAMMCPDGSYVGRSGAKCEFVCPNATSTDPRPIIVGINEDFDNDGYILNVKEVIEDSRCPSDVTCIQAGRVRVVLKISHEQGSTTEATIEQGEGVLAGLKQIVLEDVKPYPVSTHKIVPEEYRFTFSTKSQ
jgi:hypothetical protein